MRTCVSYVDYAKIVGTNPRRCFDALNSDALKRENLNRQLESPVAEIPYNTTYSVHEIAVRMQPFFQAAETVGVDKYVQTVAPDNFYVFFKMVPTGGSDQRRKSSDRPEHHFDFVSDKVRGFVYAAFLQDQSMSRKRAAKVLMNVDQFRGCAFELFAVHALEMASQEVAAKIFIPLVLPQSGEKRKHLDIEAKDIVITVPPLQNGIWEDLEAERIYIAPDSTRAIDGYLVHGDKIILLQATINRDHSDKNPPKDLMQTLFRLSKQTTGSFQWYFVWLVDKGETGRHLVEYKYPQKSFELDDGKGKVRVPFKQGYAVVRPDIVEVACPFFPKKWMPR
jgi:hypothetical protein